MTIGLVNIVDKRSDEESIAYWEEQRIANGFETIWSMWEVHNVDLQVFENKSYRVFYRFYAQNATAEEIYNDTAEMIEVSAFTAGGTVLDFWRAAESCWQQAKQHGDWHKFIEDFQMTEENGFEIWMGS